MRCSMIRPEISVEKSLWCIALPGVPIAAEAWFCDTCVTDFIDAAREYAWDWTDHLHRAPNHEQNADLVCFIQASTDRQLRNWVFSGLRCVCGDVYEDHEPKDLSVPLVNDNPLYPIPNGSVSTIATTKPFSTYDIAACHCGCTIFDLLTD
ncbi:hypothetical protein COURTHOUSE_186 [Mycobacterium phage Courthouse]|uniref:Uncharacterized protein n=1 Tax=Mycobacterium phage Courthouse TaxID=2923000 RepID=G8I5P1_9CAUD|nr:hypothetical protein CM09_gp238 [Mycobacterium phage Courthouse]YP_009205318.1 hypothetical protein AVT17_gp242 [Mycobacterium phage Ariel]YP_009213407.1 hypothetical protein AVV70_gp247 [Mycobacterium phage MiaZeal]AER48035.1 hypothetical protein COURTHOUSE_186 [Mycobacterium phage Courthouse]AIM50065.1 hypothetical protein PBI_ARIEL_190 [Mycobacterium phage Ariel]AIY32544.1 hypothetical protein PBI_MIAZEAL_192 [Mycobacterium phage MiaZeal]